MIKNRNVLLVRNVRPEDYGGGETYQLVLAGQLKKHGFRPVIVSSSRKLVTEAKRLGFEVINAPYNKRQNYSGVRNLLLPMYFLWLRKLERWYRKIFREYKPEVVNIQSRDDFIAATRVAKKMGTRVLWTDHMDFRSWVLQNVNIPYKNLIGKMILESSKNVYRIIMISDFEYNEVKKMILPWKMKNMMVIKNGAIDVWKKFEKQKFNSYSFTFIGRIVSYKGVFELIEAFLEVVKKYPEASLNFYGTGPDTLACQSRAKGCSRIHFYGYTKESLKALAENYCFVLPSYIEGLSLSLLDAAMMGKVIIASDIDGNPEVVKNNKTGFLVPARNVEKLAEKMFEVLENKKLAEKMAKNARKFYEENFDFEKIFVEKMLPLYNKKIERSKK